MFIKLLKSLSRIKYWVFFPYTLYLFIRTYRNFKLEQKYFIEAINNNEEFYKSLATMGFVPNELIKGVLHASMPFDETLTAVDIRNIANKSIIAVIMNYVKDNDLLGILNIETIIKGKEVLVELRPSSYENMLLNLSDLSISFSFWAIISSILLYFI